MAINTKTDAMLWYNVPGWDKLGLAVPNWSNDEYSQNANIRYVCSIMGRNLQALMFHDDARQTTPPSINTLARIHKLCVRARDIMASRAIPENVFEMESAHANPAPEVHLVFPTPYFQVRNRWMKDYCMLILTAMTEAMQHQENAKAIEISERFAGLVGQYIKRVYRRMAVELFQVPLEEADKDSFTMTDAILSSYKPSKWFTSTEMIDTVPEILSEPTEDTLSTITNGIPVTKLPNLGPWPAAIRTPAAGVVASDANPTGSSFIGRPSV